MTSTAIRCTFCFNTERHDHDANGVCDRCQRIDSETYQLILALIERNDMRIETNAVLSTGDTNGGAFELDPSATNRFGL